MTNKCVLCDNSPSTFRGVDLGRFVYFDRSFTLMTIDPPFTKISWLNKGKYVCSPCLDRVIYWDGKLRQHFSDWCIVPVVQDVVRLFPPSMWSTATEIEKEKISRLLVRIEMRCSNCGIVTDSDYATKAGHKWSEWASPQCDECKQAVNRLLA